MGKLINNLIKLFILFASGSAVYMLIELGFRGYTFWLMGLCGGLAFISVGAINEYIDWDMPIWLQSIIGGIIILGYELVFGILFNQDHSMWDYSELPLNWHGQICVLFFGIWCCLGAVAVVLDDVLRFVIFDEEQPHYCLWFKNKKGVA